MLQLDNRNKLIIDPEMLSIPSFRKIWDKDKTIEKKKALKLFGYIFYKYNPKSPYLKKAVGEELEKELRNDVLEDSKWTPDVDMLEAERVYSSVMTTSGTRALQSAQKMLQMISQHLDTGINLSAIEDEEKQVAVMQKLVKLIEVMPDATKALARAIRDLNDEQLEKVKKKTEEGTIFEIPRDER